MSLTTREKNITCITTEMRTRSQLIAERSAESAPFLDINVLAGLLREYADTIDTLMYHGTRGRHSSGCHCDWCTEASCQYWRVANRRRPALKKTPKQRREEAAAAAALWAQDIEGEEDL
jgi:hypothetical protein